MDLNYTADTTAAHTQSHTDSITASTTPTMHTVMEQLPLPRALKDWLVCVRKPAISLQYRIDKRHIPDLDAEPKPCPYTITTVTSSSAPSPAAAEPVSSAFDRTPEPDTPTADPSAVDPSAVDTSTIDTSATEAAARAATAPTTAGGKNSDIMTLSGGLTIRYFDLAMGMLGILMATCLFRGGCWVKRKLK